MSEKLTQRQKVKDLAGKVNPNLLDVKIYEKLCDIEDVLEKYGIETIEELDGVLKPLIENGELENWKSAMFWKMQVEKQSEQIRSLEEQLKNAIVPKFKIGQKVYFIIDSIEIGRIEKVIATLSKNDEETSMFYSLTDVCGYALRLPEEQICLTEKEAERRLAELKGETND